MINPETMKNIFVISPEVSYTSDGIYTIKAYDPVCLFGSSFFFSMTDYKRESCWINDNDLVHCVNETLLSEKEQFLYKLTGGLPDDYVNRIHRMCRMLNMQKYES